MINKPYRRYLKNKLKLCQLIKLIHKHKLLQSIIINNNIRNLYRHSANIIMLLNNMKKTTTVDICLKSAVYKKTSKWTNFSRHEYHNLCRTNKLIGTEINSW